MKVQQRMRILKKLYDIHETYTSDVQTVCQRGCSTCCTCNVTATTLESYLLYDYIITKGEGERLENLAASAPAARFQPSTTLNQMAALCLRGEALPPEDNDPTAGTCPLLTDDVCSVYSVRPLGCRTMLSTSHCLEQGEALMPPFILTVNHVMMQFVEAVDQPGRTGNLIDMLNFLSMDDFRRGYLQVEDRPAFQGLLVNHPLPVLMVPPEHRDAIQPLIQSMNKVMREMQ